MLITFQQEAGGGLYHELDVDTLYILKWKCHALQSKNNHKSNLAKNGNILIKM